MHPDKKVGLALGILLIGFVGALFFRNEAPDPDQNGPALANPQSLDSRIRHKPHAPYLPETTSTVAAATVIPDVNVPEVASHLAGTSGTNQQRHNAPVPEPIRPNGPREAEVTTPVPLPGREIAPVERSEQTARSESTQKPAVVVHEVVAGESLSSIAFKYLGTHKRFKEIYEANKDVLKSPNDLSVGMKLKIPPKDRPTSAPSVSSASAQTEPPQTMLTQSTSSAGFGSGSATPSPANQSQAPSTPNANSSNSSQSNSSQSTIPVPEPKSDEPASSRPLFVRPKSSPPRLPSKPARSLTQTAPPNVPSVEGVQIAREPSVIATRLSDDELAEPTTTSKTKSQ